jgi:hypothetical protein
MVRGRTAADYEIAVDEEVARDGLPSGVLRAIAAAPGGGGSMMQVIVPRSYRGRRVRLSAWVRTAEATEAGIWMRVDDTENQILAFDNMRSRCIRGTTDWRHQDVVLDVAPDAARLAFGSWLEGSGAIWLNDVRLEIVAADVAVTGAPGGTALRCADPTHDHPHNLRFTDA